MLGELRAVMLGAGSFAEISVSLTVSSGKLFKYCLMGGLDIFV
jgi:hypothetical protein